MPSPADLGSGRFAPKRFRHTAGIADGMTWLMLLLLSVVVIGGAVWAQGKLTDPNSFVAQRGLTAGQIWTGAIVTLALFYALVAPLVMLGLWLASLIFKFDLAGGAYLRAAAVSAVPVVLGLSYELGVLSGNIPNNPVVTALVAAISVPLAAVLAKGSFGMTVPETLVATLISAPLWWVGVFVDSRVSSLAIASGQNSTSTIAVAPRGLPAVPPMDQPVIPTTPPPRITPPTESQPAPTIHETGTPPSPAEADHDAIARLSTEVEGFTDSEITPTRLSFLHGRVASYHQRLQAFQAQSANDPALAAVARNLDDFEAKLNAPAANQQAMVPPNNLSSATPVIPPQLQSDAINAALAELDDANTSRQQEGLKTLAGLPHDPQRTDVTRKLETIVLADPPFVLDDAAKALATWTDDTTTIKMLPWLDEQTFPPNKIDAAMTVLCKTHDKRAVLPIIRWIIKRPEPTVAALIAMGPVAEDELVKTVRDPNAIARKNAARVLQEIGGSKSLIPLQKAAADARDPEAQDAAKIALDLVRQRYKDSHAATTKPA